MDLKHLLHLLRRRWITIVLMFLLAVGASAAISFSTTPQYESNARVFISTDTSTTTDAYAASFFATGRVKSYAALATSRELMQRVIRKLDLNLTPEQLSTKVTSAVAADTVIIVITVRDASPATAQQIAKAESEELADYIGEVETPLGAAQAPIKASVVDQASYSATAVVPRTALNLVVAGLLGLLLGVALAVARDVLDNTLTSSEDVAAVIDSPILASVGFDSEIAKHPLLTEAGGHSPRAESFRLLRTNLQFLNLDTPPRRIVITSAVPAEGKTSTATNLAIALAQAGKRVLLVDADLRRPKVASTLGLEPAVGLTTVLVGRSRLEESIQRHKESAIYVLASGPIPPNPTEILQSRATNDLLDRLGEMFDMVIIDAPPLLPVADAAIMARDVDGAILIVRHGKTTKDQLRQAAARLEAVDASLLGVLVNMTPKRGRHGYGYGYGYEGQYLYAPTSDHRSTKSASEVKQQPQAPSDVS